MVSVIYGIRGVTLIVRDGSRQLARAFPKLANSSADQELGGQNPLAEGHLRMMQSLEQHLHASFTDLLLVDEKRGRRTATAAGLKVTGLLGVVALATGMAHSLVQGLNRQVFWHVLRAFLTMPALSSPVVTTARAQV